MGTRGYGGKFDNIKLDGVKKPDTHRDADINRKDVDRITQTESGHLFPGAEMSPGIRDDTSLWGFPWGDRSRGAAANKRQPTPRISPGIDYTSWTRGIDYLLDSWTPGIDHPMDTPDIAPFSLQVNAGLTCACLCCLVRRIRCLTCLVEAFQLFIQERVRETFICWACYKSTYINMTV